MLSHFTSFKRDIWKLQLNMIKTVEYLCLIDFSEVQLLIKKLSTDKIKNLISLYNLDHHAKFKS